MSLEEIHGMERAGKNRKLNRKDCAIKYSPSSGRRISFAKPPFGGSADSGLQTY